MKLIGAQVLAKGFNKDADAVDKEIAKEVFAMANEISVEGKKIVPEDTGALKGSIKPKAGGRKFMREGIVTAGSVTVDYAIEQHENPNLIHKQGRRFKYLEEPWGIITSKADKRLSDAVNRAL